MSHISFTSLATRQNRSYGTTQQSFEVNPKWCADHGWGLVILTILFADLDNNTDESGGLVHQFHILLWTNTRKSVELKRATSLPGYTIIRLRPLFQGIQCRTSLLFGDQRRGRDLVVSWVRKYWHSHSPVWGMPVTFSLQDRWTRRLSQMRSRLYRHHLIKPISTLASYPSAFRVDPREDLQYENWNDLIVVGIGRYMTEPTGRSLGL